MKEHTCSKNRNTNIEIIFGPSISSSWKGWMLQKTTYANAQAVYDGQAANIGDMMFRSQFTINFCPFCGLKLEENP